MSVYKTIPKNPQAVSAGCDTLPPWQVERCQILQAACVRIKARVARGEKFKTSIRRTAGRLNGQTFKSDLSRRLKLSVNTLIRVYYTWKKAGETIEVFQFGYARHYSLFTSLVIARFADHILAHPQWSIETCWNKFSSHLLNFRGKWRPAKKGSPGRDEKGDGNRIQGAGNRNLPQLKMTSPTSIMDASSAKKPWATNPRGQERECHNPSGHGQQLFSQSNVATFSPACATSPDSNSPMALRDRHSSCHGTCG